MKKIIAVIIGVLALLTFAACSSDASKVNENLNTAADNFEVQRLIVGVNGITDKPAFLVEGRCSIEPSDRVLRVTCKHGENDYRKHHLGLSDNTYWTSTQVQGIDASVYRTRIILKPQNVIPDFDLSVGKQ